MISVFRETDPSFYLLVFQTMSATTIHSGSSTRRDRLRSFLLWPTSCVSTSSLRVSYLIALSDAVSHYHHHRYFSFSSHSSPDQHQRGQGLHLPSFCYQEQRDLQQQVRLHLPFPSHRRPLRPNLLLPLDQALHPPFGSLLLDSSLDAF